MGRYRLTGAEDVSVTDSVYVVDVVGIGLRYNSVWHVIDLYLEGWNQMSSSSNHTR